MPDVYTTGWWRPEEGHTEAFVEAWTEFARWASSQAGAGTIRLARDLKNEGYFVSFARWDSFEHMRAWKEADEFKPRMGRVQEHVAEFRATELEVVVALVETEAPAR